ncbi:LysR substrate-binding domain-containing protein [Leucobacter sp. USHLN153]|uniref:LysR substrate-binding domain-containing protein n=1 Tax=Leucobacter sp. USHLN153 TaxID=3081268 RepID=UPI003017EC46
MIESLGRLLDGRVRMRHLIFARAVADHGSLSRAAEALQVTQPYMTRSIQDLETALDVELFERGPRGMATTPAGEVFVRHAVSVINTMRQAEERLDEISKGVTRGTVRVGVNLATVHALLPNAIMRFKERNPTITVSLVEEYQGALDVMLTRNEIDMIVGRLPSERLAGNKYLTLYEDPLVLAVRRTHPLIGRGFTVQSLVGMAWIMPAHSSVFRGEIDGMFIGQGLEPPRNLIESSTITASRPILLGTDAIAVLPRSLVEADPELALLPRTVDAAPRVIGITVREGSVLDSVLSGFIEDIVAFGRELVTRRAVIAKTG